MENVQAFVEQLIKSMVDNPEEVHITSSTDEQGVLFELRVAKADMGSLIGKQGATIQAVRMIVKIIGMKHGMRISVRLQEPDGSYRHTASSRPRFGSDTAYDETKEALMA